MKLKPVHYLVLALVILAIAGIGYLAFRINRANKVDDRIAELTEGGAAPETIEGLREAITLYETKINEQVQNAAQAGIYWKLLARRYMDRGMYEEALSSLKRAVEYFPEDSTLYYLTGLSASVTAKSTLDFARKGSAKVERERLFALAEEAHKRAIELDPKNARALYALGVLYVFELDRSEEAIPFLERYILLQSKDVDAMFVLARAYYVNKKRDEAVALYDRIIETTKDEQKKSEADANKRTVLDAAYVSN